MKRTALAGVVLAAAAMTTGASVAPSAQSRPARLVLIDNITDISFPAAPAPGVAFTSTADVLDTAGNRIGDLGGLCGVLTLDQNTLLSTAHCETMWTLPGGQINVAVKFPFLIAVPDGGYPPPAEVDRFDGVVTGGNGRYRGARGEVHYEHIGDAPSGFYQFRVTFTLTY